MSQSIHLRFGAVKYFFILAAILIVGGGLYWTLDRFVINPELSFQNIDTGTKAVRFDEAPLFELPNLANKYINIENFKNKIVIVNFWASWCAPCIEEFPSLMKYINTFKGDVVLLAVSQDNNIDDVNKFLNSFQMSTNEHFEILFDLDRKVGKMYAVGALPESYIFNKNLKFHRKIVGFRNWMSPSSIKEVEDLIKN